MRVKENKLAFTVTSEVDQSLSSVHCWKEFCFQVADARVCLGGGISDKRLFQREDRRF